ncbi:SRPBCC domain-containing protein [Geodermatophilus sp. SYSU D00965]
MTTASGTREVPFDRARVWRALAVLAPYCTVCDVSYVVDGSGAPRVGTTFLCVPGRLDADAQPPAGAPRGEIVEWDPERTVATRLELTPETWTTRIELADAGPGATRVTITLTHEPRSGGRLVRRLQRGAVRQMVQRTVDGELDKLPAHVEQLIAG